MPGVHVLEKPCGREPVRVYGRLFPDASAQSLGLESSGCGIALRHQFRRLTAVDTSPESALISRQNQQSIPGEVGEKNPRKAKLSVSFTFLFAECRSK
jgi:hypothetical protein